jgi:hypothetical protein
MGAHRFETSGRPEHASLRDFDWQVLRRAAALTTTSRDQHVFDHGAATGDSASASITLSRIRQANRLSACASGGRSAGEFLPAAGRRGFGRDLDAPLGHGHGPRQRSWRTARSPLRARKRQMVVNVGNFHTLRLASAGGIEAPEHHTGLLTRQPEATHLALAGTAADIRRCSATWGMALCSCVPRPWAQAIVPAVTGPLPAVEGSAHCSHSLHRWAT